MSFLLVGDVHLADKPPASCTPDYNDQIFAVLEEIAILADRNGVEGVIFAGDIFHSKIPIRTSHATMTRLLDILGEIGHGRLPPAIVPGNHDMQNDRIESLDTQPLGTVFASHRATELNGTYSLPFKGDVIGVPWQQDWSKFDIHFKSNTLYVMHAPIMPASASAPFDHIPREGIFQMLREAKCENATVFYGHIHDDHGIVYDEAGNYIVNLGAISRGSLAEVDLDRKLQVCFVDDNWYPISIPLTTIPITDVIRPEAIDKRRDQVSAQSFISSLQGTVLTRLTPQAVCKAAEDMGADGPVIALIRELMQA